MDFPVESYSFLPGSRAILDLSHRSRLRNSNYTMSQQSRPTISMFKHQQQSYDHFANTSLDTVTIHPIMLHASRDTQWRSQPEIWSCKCEFFSVYRPYRESISKEMNNENDLNLHSMTKFSGWLRYWRHPVTLHFVTLHFVT